jgi:hypothetical protein
MELCAGAGERLSRGAATSGSLKLKAPEGESRSGSPVRVLGGVKWWINEGEEQECGRVGEGRADRRREVWCSPDDGEQRRAASVLQMAAASRCRNSPSFTD